MPYLARLSAGLACQSHLVGLLCRRRTRSRTRPTPRRVHPRRRPRQARPSRPALSQRCARWAQLKIPCTAVNRPAWGSGLDAAAGHCSLGRHGRRWQCVVAMGYVCMCSQTPQTLSLCLAVRAGVRHSHELPARRDLLLHARVLRLLLHLGLLPAQGKVGVAWLALPSICQHASIGPSVQLWFIVLLCHCGTALPWGSCLVKVSCFLHPVFALLCTVPKID